MAVKPVKFISDIETRKQIIKTDIRGNVLFNVSGTLLAGSVSSSLPITASALFIDGNAYISDTIHAKRMHVTEVTTSVYYEDSLSASINALLDVSASNAQIGDFLRWDGTNWIADSSLSSQNLNVQGTLSIAGASLPQLGSPTAQHDVAALFLNINNKFDALSLLSETITGSFDIDGFKNVELTNFSFADLDYVSVDVMTKQSGTFTWKNDLISVELSGNIETNKIHVLITAAELTDVDYYRIIANKQTGSL